MSILVSLTPSESKRLIARAVAAHPLVKEKLKHGRVYLSSGTTTGYCAQEILGRRIAVEKFACGVITQGMPCLSPEDRERPIMIRDGWEVPPRPYMARYDELVAHLEEMTGGDLFIKGANAIDPQGNAGFLLAHPNGGAMLVAMRKIFAQGMRCIIPTGLEKLVSSVPEAQRRTKGIGGYFFTFGQSCGYVSMSNGIVIHEIAALNILAGVEAVHVASGGVGGSEGSVCLVVSGTPEQEEKTVALLKEIKGEPPVPAWRRDCSDCSCRCKYIYGHEAAPGS